eukprot:8324956-Ditylum_brightwellii.AAC.1
MKESYDADDESGIKGYSQWFPGKKNNVANALSQDNDQDDRELTLIFRHFLPSQVPKHFRILQLPNEISFWLNLLLLKVPVKEQLQEKHTRASLGCGEGGKNMSTQLELTGMSSLTAFQEFSGETYDTLAEGTVRGAISYVAQTFKENDHPNPTKDKDSKLGRLLLHQYRAFQNKDKKPR